MPGSADDMAFPVTALGSQNAPMPPLPDMQTAPQSNKESGHQDIMASLMSGIAPVKSSVDRILQECKAIVKSGVIPGAEQICGQIVAAATSLLPMAAQNLLQPSSAQGVPSGQGGPGGMNLMPPPGGPVPMQ